MPVFKSPEWVPKHFDGRPYVFLAGPIQGAPDWQKTAVEILLAFEPTMVVASPRSEMWSRDLSEQEKEQLYTTQAKWEHDHLERALRHNGGVVLLFLPEEEEHLPRRAYAQTTRVELGLILGNIAARHGELPFQPDFNAMRQSESARRIVVGADRGFPGRKYISLMLKKYDIPLNDTLAEACRSVLQRFK